MDFTYRTPLLELFSRGEVPTEARLLAARGALAPRAHEQLVLLAMLTDDSDREVAATACATLDRIPHDTLAAFLGRSDVADDLRAFFQSRGVVPASRPADSGIDETGEAPLVVSEDVAADAQAEEEPPATEAERAATAQRLAKLPVAERMKRAMLGTREERFLLIHDTNRLIATCVLSSPKLTASDVESFARMQNVAEDVLRMIGNSRAWVKRYPVAAALALNPKTPVTISLALVQRLVERDIKAIVRDRNMAEPLRAAARRAMATNESRRS
jgi:hypothetical protein